MKTKFTFRVIFATMFVLGTMAMNAQTVGENLLLNPGFEDGADNATIAANATLAGMPDSWTAVSDDWATSYYGDTKGDAFAAPNRATLYWFTTTTPTMKDFVTGSFSARVPGNGAGGMYQVVTVTPGATYDYGCDIGYRDNSGTTAGSQVADPDLGVKILNDADGTLIPGGIIYVRDIDPVSSTYTGGNGSTYAQNLYYSNGGNKLTGKVAIPAGVTAVRFQVDQRSYNKKATVMVWDECFFSLSDNTRMQTPQASASVSVFPNPAQTDITVSGTVSGTKVKLFNIGGILLKTVPAQENSTNVDVSFLPKGLYLLQTGGQTVKLIKK